MTEEVTNISEVKTLSDGTVNISLEKYNDMVETISRQKSSINRLQSEPPVINRTTVVKTAEMAAKEYRVWGGAFMGLGATLFAVGVFLYRAGRV